MELSNKILSDITVYMKYARYLPELKRRETWQELVTRNMNMHIKKFPNMEDEIRSAYEYVYDKKVLPSMRSMQFGGKPIEVAPNRILLLDVATTLGRRMLEVYQVSYESTNAFGLKWTSSNIDYNIIIIILQI